MTTPPSAFNRRDRAYPRMGVERDDPIVQAVTDKLTAPLTGNTNRKKRPLQNLDVSMIDQISRMTSENVMAVKSLKQLLPDLELVEQIIVSSILSPKDLAGSELNYSFDPGRFDPEMGGPMLDVLRDYFENTYKMGELLPKALSEALYGSGAYPLLILPENSIDEVINNPTRASLESLRREFDTNNNIRHVGILGNPKAAKASGVMASFESLFSRTTPNVTTEVYIPSVNPLKLKVGDQTKEFDPKLSVVDNANILRMPMIAQKMREDHLQDLLSSKGLGLEAQRPKYFEHGLKKEESGSFYRRRRFIHQPVMAASPATSLKRKTVGHPLVLQLPTESVIPVHVPANPEQHLGYFILLDELGHPLVRAVESDYYANMSSSLAQNDVFNRMIQKTSSQTQGVADPLSLKRRQVEQISNVYADLLEEELSNRLKSGPYGENVKVAKPTEVYRIMLARALANMHTQVLYVPAEMMTYIAFDYNQFGIGESLIQKSKIIGGMRVMLMFANTMAALKNSISQTKITINLDPNDDDPSATVEFLYHEHAKLRSASFPLGSTHPADLINHLQNAGISVEVNGNTGYPETKVLLEDIQSARIKPDTDLEDKLRKQHLMSLWVSPETVDAGANAQFATTIVIENQLLTKRVIMTQAVAMMFIQDIIQKYTLSSGTLMDQLREVVRQCRSQLKNGDGRRVDSASTSVQSNAGGHRLADAAPASPTTVEERPLEHGRLVDSANDADGDQDDDIDAVIMDFVNSVETSLPAPDTTKLKTQMDAFTEYSTALDTAIAAYISEDFMTNVEYEGLAEYIKPAIAGLKAQYQRQWLRSNNVLPELDDLTTQDSGDVPALNLLETHEKHIDSFRQSFLPYLQAIAAARKQAAAETQQVADALGGSSDLGGGNDGGTGGNDTDTGDGTLDFGTDLGTDDTAASTTDTDAPAGGDLTDQPDATKDGTAGEQSSTAQTGQEEQMQDEDQ